MHIALLCATRRGFLFLQELTKLLPDAKFTVCSFREEVWEPPFLDNIRDWTTAHNGTFFETKQVGNSTLLPYWETANVDLMFAISWRYIVPRKVYQLPRLGTF